MKGRRPARGATLLELIITLAMLGIIAGIGGLTMLQPRDRHDSDQADAIARLRRVAIASGRDTSVVLTSEAQTLTVLARATGLVLIDSTSRGRP